MLSSASLNVFSADDQLLMSKDISFQNKAGIVFNSDLLQINEVLDSAAGEVWITDVASKASRKVTGIYLDRILNRL